MLDDSSSAACDGPYLHSVGRLPDWAMCWPMRVRADVNDALTWQSRHRLSGSVVILTRQHGLPFLHVLPTLIEDLLDIIGRSYDGIYYVVLHDVHETILDPGKSDHPLAAGGVVPQPPCNVAANLYLHTGLAEFDIAVAAKLKAHHVLHDPDEAAPHSGPEDTPLEGDL